MWRRIGLRVRLSALVALGATTVTTIAALALYREVSHEVSDTITAELQVRMADLAGDLSDADRTTTQRPVVTQVVGPSGTVLVPFGADSLLTSSELEAALGRQVLVDRPVAGIGRDARLLARRLEWPGRGAVVGITATSTAPLEHVRDRLVIILLVATPVLTGAVTLLAWVLAGAALRPVRRMARRAESISMTAAGERLPEPAGHDEIAELGRTLNAMLERIEITIAHERAFIDDASHELRTPLAVVRGELELALQDDDGQVIREGIASALEETDRLARLAESLLTLARVDAGAVPDRSSSCDLTAAAHRAVSRLPRHGVTVTVTGHEATVWGQSEWVDQIVINLVANAVDHARTAVRVDVVPVDGSYRLTVADDGPGFPPDLLPRIFDRFTRGDGARGRGGAGLGLAIVAGIARLLGGDTRAANGPPLGGGRVEVTLPGGATNGGSHSRLTP